MRHVRSRARRRPLAKKRQRRESVRQARLHVALRLPSSTRLRRARNSRVRSPFFVSILAFPHTKAFRDGKPALIATRTVARSLSAAKAIGFTSRFHEARRRRKSALRRKPPVNGASEEKFMAVLIAGTLVGMKREEGSERNAANCDHADRARSFLEQATAIGFFSPKDVFARREKDGRGGKAM